MHLLVLPVGHDGEVTLDAIDRGCTRPAATREAFVATVEQAREAGLSVREVAGLLDLSDRGARSHVASLIADGRLVRDGPRGRLHTTTSIAAAGEPAPLLPTEVSPLDSLGPALAALPTEAHRAAFRLLVAAVIARWHCGQQDPSGWPSFLFYGPSTTAKTLLAIGACRVFGIDPARHIRSLPTETERSTWGRLSQTRGGRWTFTPAAVLGYPLAVWDEHDKARGEVQRGILRMLQGDVLVAGEGDELVAVRPTVVLTGNGRPHLIPAEFLRRSVVLDTRPLTAQLGEVHGAAGRFLDALPRLDLDSLRLPEDRMPAEVADVVLRTARQGLSDAGWRAADERSVLHLAIGMAALRADDDLRGTGLVVVGDYLTCARTVGETADPVPATVPGAAARRRLAEEHEVREREKRRQARAEDIELAGRISEAVAVLRSVRPDPEGYAVHVRSQVVRVAGGVDALLAMVEDADSLEELVEVVQDGRAVHDQARAIRGDRLAFPLAERLSNVIDVYHGEAEPRWRCTKCEATFPEDAVVERGRSWWRAWCCPECDSASVEEMGDDSEPPAQIAVALARAMALWLLRSPLQRGRGGPPFSMVPVLPEDGP